MKTPAPARNEIRRSQSTPDSADLQSVPQKKKPLPHEMKFPRSRANPFPRSRANPFAWF